MLLMDAFMQWHNTVANAVCTKYNYVHTIGLIQSFLDSVFLDDCCRNGTSLDIKLSAVQ